MITWTYSEPPYIESGPELYDDLVLAYNNGAKYAMVFNYPQTLIRHGILTQDHLNALKDFWNYSQL